MKKRNILIIVIIVLIVLLSSIIIYNVALKDVNKVTKTEISLNECKTKDDYLNYIKVKYKDSNATFKVMGDSKEYIRIGKYNKKTDKLISLYTINKKLKEIDKQEDIEPQMKSGGE